MSDERFIPGTSRITEIESFHRYLAAADLCHGKKVLDIACGEGYGSNILASVAREVVGVDICQEAIDQAGRKYVSNNIAFVCGDAYSIPFPDGEFDCVVSFETIEHLEKPERLLAEIRRVLKPEGFVILSSPNKKPFDRRNHCENGENIYHIKEMDFSEIAALMAEFFQKTVLYSQDSFFSSQISGQDSAMRYFVKNSSDKIIRQESLQQPQYAIVLAGNGDLPVLPTTSYMDVHFDEQFGYQPDDESIVNQFGLHGEFEKITTDLAEKSKQLEQLKERETTLTQSINDERNAHQKVKEQLSDTLALAEQLRNREISLGKALDDEKNIHQETRNRLFDAILQMKQLQDRENSFVQALNDEKKAHQETRTLLSGALQKIDMFQDRENSFVQALNDEKNAHQKTRTQLSETLHKVDLFQERENSFVKALNNEKNTLQETRTQLSEALQKVDKLQDRENSFVKTLDDEKKAHQKTRIQLSETLHKVDLFQEREALLLDHLATAKTSQEQAGKEMEFLRKSLDDKNAELQNAHDYLGTLESQYNVACTTVSTIRKDLSSTEQKLISSEHDLKECREKLQAAENDLTSFQGKLTDQNNLHARIRELERNLTEERGRAQYFQAEYESLQSAWSLRIFGRFHLRQHVRNAVQALRRSSGQLHHLIQALSPVRLFHSGAQFLRSVHKREVDRFKLAKFHLWEKSLNWRKIPFDKQVQLLHSAYERYGSLLENEPEYRDWLTRQKFDFYKTLQSGAGLIVPEDLPLTSIIIPVYNNLKFTLFCLHSIYSINSKAPFEVIVVDDCSQEDYSVLHRHYPQVRLVRNQKNLGFLLTANRGAQEAKGEYLVFLNNDTEVLPAWLDELATALYHHPEAGMIGSQLIHMRTGTLQESGNLICKNGEMLPRGRGVDPNHPELTYFCEVDFVSAASIIMRKKVFDEMKGFDTCYAPAYFEDPDLGLRLQKAGYHNYVMPLSRVLHYEMISYGNTLEGACEKNRQFFFRRWKDYLAKHALYDDIQDFTRCRKFARERLLYIDAEMPMADRGSGGMDAIFFMEYFLKRGLDVVFHGEYTPGGKPKYTEILLRMGVECVILPHRKIWEYLEAAGWCFKWLFISRVYQAQCFDGLLKRFCSQAHYIFNTVDLHFIREKLEADLRDDPKLRRQAKWTKMFELAVAKNADATIVISQDEKRILENEYGLVNVWHIPQARPVAGRKENVERKGAVFVGSAHPPNMDGLRYFHDEVLPLLPPDFHLTIIGEALRDVMSQNPEYQDLLQCPQFRFVGFVQNLGDVFNTAKLSIAPLRYGAGTKGKVASSMSYGVPCVSTNFGVEGTGMIPGENIMLGRTPQEFADAIRKLCTDPVLWRKISDGGLEFLRSKYDPAHVAAEVDKIFDFITDKYNRSPQPHGDWAGIMALPKQEELDAVALE